MNADVIEKIESFQENLNGLQQPFEKEYVRFRLNEIDIDKNPFLGDIQFSKKSMSKLLSFLKVKNDFLDYKTKVTDVDWEEIKYILSSANRESMIWGEKTKNNEGKFEFSDLMLRRNFDKDQLNLPRNFNEYFDKLVDSLGSTEQEYTLKSIHKSKNDIGIELLNNNFEYDLFGGGNDNWTGGLAINFNNTEFNISPFYERLVCSNGLRTTEKSKYMTLSSDKFNINIINTLIENYVNNPNYLRDNEFLSNQANLLNENFLSVSEFMRFKKVITSMNDDDKYDNIINKLFNMNDIYKNYGDVEEKSNRWLSTANSGRNGYEFFNDITALCTHRDVTNIEDDLAKSLNIQASNLFFSKKLDLMDVAEPMNFKVERLFNDTQFQKK